MQEGGEERESTIWRWTGDFGRFTFFFGDPRGPTEEDSL